MNFAAIVRALHNYRRGVHEMGPCGCQERADTLAALAVVRDVACDEAPDRPYSQTERVRGYGTDSDPRAAPYCDKAVYTGDKTVPCALTQGHAGSCVPSKLNGANGLIVPREPAWPAPDAARLTEALTRIARAHAPAEHLQAIARDALAAGAAREGTSG